MSDQFFLQFNSTVITVVSCCTLFTAPAIASDSYYEYNFLVTQDWHSCKHINKNYQEVYAFETPSFYINICRQGKNYFYLGEPKNTTIGSIFLPVEPINEGKTYRANNGNMSYYVTINDIKPKTVAEAQGTLTVKRNNILVLTENALTQYCRMVNWPIGLNVRIKPDQQAKKIATIPVRTQVTLADLDRQGNPDFKQGLNDSLWVEISEPYEGFILYGTKKEPSLTTCQDGDSLSFNNR